MKNLSGFLILLFLTASVHAAQFQANYSQISNPWFRKIHFDQPIKDEESTIPSVFTIYQDRTGFLWFATQDGLIKYDGYNLKTYRHDPNQKNSISDSWVYDILEDERGGFWLGTFGGGLNYFDPVTEQFRSYINHPSDPTSLGSNEIYTVRSDGEKGLWVAHKKGVDWFDPASGRVIRLFEQEYTPEALRDSIGVHCVWRDSGGLIWLGTIRAGLWTFEPKTKVFKNWFQTDQSLKMEQLNILSMIPHKKGGWWLGTLGGLAYMDERGALTWFHQNDDIHKGLMSESIYSLFVDSENMLWVGSDDGLHLFLPEEKRFQRFVPERHGEGTRITHQIRSIMEDRNGILWVGEIVGGLTRYNRNAPPFLHYRSQADSEISLSSNYVKSIYQDPEGILWIGTMGGGFDRIDRIHNTFTNFRSISENQLFDNKPMGDKITAICRDLKGNYWIAMWDKGLDIFDGKTNFRHFLPNHDQPNAIATNRIRTITRASDGRMWIGSIIGLQVCHPETLEQEGFKLFAPNQNFFDVWHILEDPKRGLWVSSTDGLYLFNPATEKFIARYAQNSQPQGGLSHNRVRSTTLSHDGTIWLATSGGGLNHLDPESGKVEVYTTSDGLANDALYGVLEDLEGKIWLSSNRGLTRLDPSSRPPQIKNFTRDQGLQHHEFNSGSFFLGKDGELFFGGIGGMNAFFPSKFRGNHRKPAVAITSFQLMAQSVPLGSRLNAQGKLVLKPSENFFHFEFAALDYAQTKANRYLYKMEGLDSDWMDAGHRNIASYTNLSPGQYRFRVKAANGDGVWNDDGIDLPIQVLPPWWRTYWAYLLYFMLFVGVIAYYVSMQRQKLANERALVERLRMIDRLKDEFLANTSHELRTPLNGIIGLTESLLDGAAGAITGQMQDSLRMVSVSGRRLANLVNDLLDFSVLKNGQLEMRPKAIDLHSFAEVVLTLSRPLVENKALMIHNSVPEDLPSVQADEDRLQQVLLNLLGNAIKFTEAGEVEISARLKYETEGPVLVEIRDTGIGIEPSLQDRIWNSFEQVDGSIARKYGGAGLGLAITKQLIECMGGNIWVESKLGEGSSFRFTLPLSLEEKKDKIQRPKWLEQVSEPMILRSAPRPKNGNSFKILVVDDEPINRMVILQQLALEPYDISEASDGEEALAKIEAGEVPDLILLDVMMPRVSGYQVCERLRKNYPSHELPIIFLTAKNQMVDLVQGFQLGANDYLGKPISKNELLARVGMHLQLLDVTRRLEQKVEERTKELLLKNVEILKAQNQLITQEKMVSVGILTSGIAHQLKNPLNFIKNFAELVVELANELLENDPENNAGTHEIANMIQDNASLILKHGLRANEIFSEMHLFTEKNSKPEELPFNEFLEKYVAIAIQGGDYQLKQPFDLHLDLDPAIGTVQLSKQSFRRAFLNIFRNSIEALHERRSIQPNFKPELNVTSRLKDNSVELSIRDNGIGITDEVLPLIFNPFFTTKPTDSNHIGLGLFISYDVIVKEHSGSLSVQSIPNEFTEVCLHLPLTFTRV